MCERIHNDDAERNPATAHLFIINPLSGERMDNLFSTHPNTENRIAALQAMEQEFSRDAPDDNQRQPRSGAPAPAPTQPRASAPSDGPWGSPGKEPSGEPNEAPQKSKPWGRNPTGPKNAGKGRWS